MKKQRKKALAAAAVLMMMLAAPGTAAGSILPAAPAGSSADAQVSAGWRQEADGWAYYDKSGARAVNTWAESEDGNTLFYLDEGGRIAVDKLIPYDGGISYVDETGAQVKNDWAVLPNDGLWDEPVENVFYYFGSNGKAARDTKRKIGAKTYFFDADGHMLSGWHEDGEDYYYLGAEDEGFIHTGWQHLTPMDTEESGIFDRWYYFHRGSGKAYRGKKRIEDAYYYFDEDTAAMQEGWVEWENQYTYYKPESGKLATGWTYCGGPEDGEKNWYYLDKDGVPFNYGGKDSRTGESVIEGDTIYTYAGRALDSIGPYLHNNLAARTIQGDTYLFDEYGRMMTGRMYLWVINNIGGKPLGPQKMDDDGGYTYGGCYLFDNRDGASLGKMLKNGRKKVTQDGANYYYHFDSGGRADENYIVDGYLYGAGGDTLDPDYGEQYLILDLAEMDDSGETETSNTIRIKGSSRVLKDCLLIVDRRGKVKKSGALTYGGYRYTVKDYAAVRVPVEEAD